ncbi:hypothetical protein Y032_0039g22 [Ancylostoma ceylanicum]|uniref:Uncharacterized protein n=1 Tax=Ancylostoma ceylanicum TaxID=53326 RepID=A0A016UI07_9BILA|nr:hypothetical protein Y032_0039g22 [Ancylostoma ceylanicum]
MWVQNLRDSLREIVSQFDNQRSTHRAIHSSADLFAICVSWSRERSAGLRLPARHNVSTRSLLAIVFCRLHSSHPLHLSFALLVLQMRLQSCFLCGAHRTLMSVHNVTDSDRAFNLILLSTLARYNITSLEGALAIYKDSTGKVVRICREHFIQAKSYIGSEAEQLWPEFSTVGLCGAPTSVVDALLAHIRMYATMLDDEMELNVNHMLSFYSKLITRDYSTQLNMLPLQKQELRRLQGTSNSTSSNRKPSTSTECVPAPAGERGGGLN